MKLSERLKFSIEVHGDPGRAIYGVDFPMVLTLVEKLIIHISESHSVRYCGNHGS